MKVFPALTVVCAPILYGLDRCVVLGCEPNRTTIGLNTARSKLIKRNLIFMVALAAFACGKKSKDDDDSPVEDDALPRWTVVDRAELSFSYYVTNAESPFQLIDENIGAVAVQPWLKLKGLEDESMNFVMIFEAADAVRCRQLANNKAFSWQGIAFDAYPEGQTSLFEETNKTLSTGKQQSIVHFLMSKGDETCAKLTFYDIDLKGYDHKLSIFDGSEMSKAIREIAASLRLK